MNNPFKEITFGTTETNEGTMYFVTDGIIKGNNSLRYGVNDGSMMLFPNKDLATSYLTVCEMIASRYTPAKHSGCAATWTHMSVDVDKSNGEANKAYRSPDFALTAMVESLGLDISEGFYNEDIHQLCENLKRDETTVKFQWYIDLFNTNSPSDREYRKELMGYVRKFGMY